MWWWFSFVAFSVFAKRQECLIFLQVKLSVFPFVIPSNISCRTISSLFMCPFSVYLVLALQILSRCFHTVILNPAFVQRTDDRPIVRCQLTEATCDAGEEGPCGGEVAR